MKRVRSNEDRNEVQLHKQMMTRIDAMTVMWEDRRGIGGVEIVGSYLRHPYPYTEVMLGGLAD